MKITGELPNNSTKAEEIAVLNELVQHIGDQTYLAQLFSKPFLTWAKEQISYDFSLDLYGYFHQAEEEKAREHDLLVEQERYRMIDKQGYEHAIERIQSDLEYTKDLLHSWQKNSEELTATLTERCIQLAAQNETVSKLEQQVKELKAKLYDLMTKEA